QPHAEHHAHISAHPEVLGVHVQLVTVKFAQLSKTPLRFSRGRRSAACREKGEDDHTQTLLMLPPGTWADDWEPNLPGQGLGTTIGHIDLAPEAGDELLLLGCPVHHGGASPSLHPVSSVSQTRHPQGQSVPPHAGGKLGPGCAVHSLMPISSACPPGSRKYNINFMSDFKCLVTAWH
uniref:Uncharacterized protein n=1 Tax=Anas zonorhyncha TaxID=75864 RepID=A0A8B9VER1_9AVES